VPRMLKDRFGDLKTVKDYGAVGDGVTDDTVAIQAALNASHDVFIPAGTYKINGDSAFTGGGKDCVDGGIAPRSDSRIVLAPDATLKAKANSTGNYCVLRIKGVSNVTVTGGTIDGNRAAGTGPGGSQYGYAIGIVGSTNIVIDSMLLKNAWGDGIVTDNTRVPDPVVTTANVLINNVVSDNNRRQGLSILNGTDILVQNSVFSNSNGVAPQDGIDIEPGGDTNFAKRITIIGCNAKNNAGHGINVQGTSTGVNVEDINLTGNTVTSNSLNGINLYTASGGVNLTGNTARSNTQDGFHLEIASNVNLTGNHATSNTGDGFSLSNGVSNVTLTGNDTLGNTRGVVVFDAGGTRPTGIVISANAIKQSNQHGIYFLNTDDSLIVGNLVTSASQSANNTYHGINVQTSNRIGIVGNSMRQGALANRPGYGLILNQGADLTIASNDFINSGLAGVMYSRPRQSGSSSTPTSGRPRVSTRLG
jgi:parallel beta-helix repeat protein